MKNNKIYRIVICVLLFALLLGGCRIRIVSEEEDAKEIQTTTAPPQTQAETEETGSTEAAETEPPAEVTEAQAQTEPAQPEETTEPEAPDETKPSSQQGGSHGGKPQEPSSPGTQQGPGTAPTAPAQEETEPEPPETAEDDRITVYLDPNGGDDPISYFSVRPGDPYGPLPDANRRGYVFNGWWTEPEGGERIFSDSVVLAAEDHSLYAHWSDASRFRIRFNGNGGRVKPKDESMELRPGELFGLLPTPLWEGYDFLGWFTDPTEGTQILADTVFEGGADLTLYAHWQYDAVAYWTFVLQNKTQQIYLCQQKPIYFEKTEDHLTQTSVGLIDDTGSVNIAQYLSDPETTDDWVLEKNPEAVIKCVASMSQAESVRAGLAQRFPGKQIFLVTEEALGSGRSGLYARLYIAKALYGDWYTDVELETVARELGIGASPVS